MGVRPAAARRRPFLTPRGSVFAFATDLEDEGLQTVLERAQNRAGLSAVSLAVAYHHARDVFPHNPVRKVRYLEGGAVFFRPDPSLYRDTPIRPEVSRLAARLDMLEALLSAAGRRGMAVRAWCVYLHNTTLASRHLDCAVQNAFGDPYINYLCPAHPHVRAFVGSLTADLARRGVDAILAEALTYQPYEHRYHHDRSFVHLGPWARFFLSLCFCAHCLAAARPSGVDGEAVRRFVRRELEAIFDNEAASQPDWEPGRAEVAEGAGGELGGYLSAREEVVRSLVGAAAQAARQAGSRFTFMEMSGGIQGFATGRPTGGTAADIAWRQGVHLPAVAGAVDALEVIGYVAAPERLRRELDAYQAAVPASTPLELALRPMAPDSAQPDNLAAKVALAARAGVGWIDFYHYGFMHLSALDWIRRALEPPAPREEEA